MRKVIMSLGNHRQNKFAFGALIRWWNIVSARLYCYNMGVADCNVSCDHYGQTCIICHSIEQSLKVDD